MLSPQTTSLACQPVKGGNAGGTAAVASAANAGKTPSACREPAYANTRTVGTYVATYGRFAWRANAANPLVRTSCAAATVAADLVDHATKGRNARLEFAYRLDAYPSARASSAATMAATGNAEHVDAAKPARMGSACFMAAMGWNAVPTAAAVLVVSARSC